MWCSLSDRGGGASSSDHAAARWWSDGSGRAQRAQAIHAAPTGHVPLVDRVVPAALAEALRAPLRFGNGRHVRRAPLVEVKLHPPGHRGEAIARLAALGLLQRLLERSGLDLVDDLAGVGPGDAVRTGHVVCLSGD